MRRYVPLALVLLFLASAALDARAGCKVRLDKPKELITCTVPVSVLGTKGERR